MPRSSFTSSVYSCVLPLSNPLSSSPTPSQSRHLKACYNHKVRPKSKFIPCLSTKSSAAAYFSGRSEADLKCQTFAKNSAAWMTVGKSVICTASDRIICHQTANSLTADVKRRLTNSQQLRRRSILTIELQNCWDLPRAPPHQL